MTRCSPTRLFRASSYSVSLRRGSVHRGLSTSKSPLKRSGLKRSKELLQVSKDPLKRSNREPEGSRRKFLEKRVQHSRSSNISNASPEHVQKISDKLKSPKEKYRIHDSYRKSSNCKPGPLSYRRNPVQLDDSQLSRCEQSPGYFSHNDKLRKSFASGGAYMSERDLEARKEKRFRSSLSPIMNHRMGARKFPRSPLKRYVAPSHQTSYPNSEQCSYGLGKGGVRSESFLVSGPLEIYPQRARESFPEGTVNRGNVENKQNRTHRQQQPHFSFRKNHLQLINVKPVFRVDQQDPNAPAVWSNKVSDGITSGAIRRWNSVRRHSSPTVWKHDLFAEVSSDEQPKKRRVVNLYAESFDELVIEEE